MLSLFLFLCCLLLPSAQGATAIVDYVALSNFRSQLTSLGSWSWDTNASPCDTTGGWIICNSNGKILQLSLYKNGLSGTISQSLGNLTSLVGLDLGTNNLTGTIPPQLANTPLVELLLDDNQLGGTVPTELKSLGLEKLYLSSNKFCPNIDYSSWAITTDFVTLLPCAECGCGKGSPTNTCNYTGVCTCSTGYTGVKCDSCAASYSGYPNCQQEKKSEPKSRAGAVAAGIVVPLIFIAMLAAAFFLLKNRLKAISINRLKSSEPQTNSMVTLPTIIQTNKSGDYTTVVNAHAAIALPGYLQIDREAQIKIEKRLTSGGGGSIFIAVALDPVLKERNGGSEKIVVKEVTPHKGFSPEQNSQLFRQEVSALGALSYHPHVAKLIGYSDSPMSIIHPLYSGDLFAFIHSKSRPEIKMDQKIHLVMQIIDGMTAVHAAGVVHRDIKTKNILLEATSNPRFPFNVRISDFGICRIIQEPDAIRNQNFTNVFGMSVRYAAPEVITKNFMPNMMVDPDDEKKADVYSFAICVWELLLRKLPWEGVSTEQVQAKVCQGERPALSSTPPSNDWERTLVGLILSCWHQSPSKRPAFKDLAERFQGVDPVNINV